MPDIQTTLGALVRAEAALERLGAVKLPPKPSYHLAKLIRLVQIELTHFHAERAKLVREFGIARPASTEESVTMGPTVLQVPPTKVADFSLALEELGRVPVTLAWGPFDLAALNGEMIAAADLVALGPLVSFEEGGLHG